VATSITWKPLQITRVVYYWLKADPDAKPMLLKQQRQQIAAAAAAAS